MSLTEDSKHIIKQIKGEKLPMYQPCSSKNTRGLFKNIFATIQKYYEISKKTVQYDIERKVIENMGYIPSEIMSSLIHKRIYCVKHHIILNNRNVEVLLHFIDEPTEKSILNILRKIRHWFMFINNYAHTSNAIHIELNIYFTNDKKKMPNEGTYFNTKHVNTAVTSSCREKTSIYLYRTEEWFKVLMHESFHNLGIDFSCLNNTNADEMMYEIFGMKQSDTRLYEAYCEIWALFINSCFVAFYTTKNKKDYQRMITKMDLILQHETIFSLYQTGKILNHYGMNYSDLFNENNKSTLKKRKYNELTHIFSYFMIKTILLYFKEHFVKWCIGNNNGSFVFLQSHENIERFCNFILVLTKSRDINTMTNVVETNDGFMKNTSRMTAYELLIE
jgi:hypothetical protein